MKSAFLLCLLVKISSNLGANVPSLGIVNGTSVSIEDYPYQASIQFYRLHGCGGSILNEKFILTAAHCIYDVTADIVSVRLGSSIRNDGGTVYQVSEIHQHPSFNSKTYDYDVAILELEDNIAFGTGVKPITLATSGTIIADGLPAVATGWGRMYQGGPPSDQLQMVVLPTISTAACANFYPEGFVTERMFCAGYDEGGKDTCEGDSGGPLVVSGILIGITSWGDICAKAKSPGAYTNIPNLIDYIDSIIN
ncbi:unnamed protein product [Phaedon cochleariae]|uniref:Peptidase S1 domain-containing protein n=1 Tax=Phaedon cochleariae TaxID=80249 RepID=A0A9P0DQU7_PHACE|nr:unnamed protein product [Phaedon cochleariae]